MEYTTVPHLLLSSLFIKDAQERQLIFKTRASEKPRERSRKPLEEATDSTILIEETHAPRARMVFLISAVTKDFWGTYSIWNQSPPSQHFYIRDHGLLKQLLTISLQNTNHKHWKPFQDLGHCIHVRRVWKPFACCHVHDRVKTGKY